MPATTSCVCEPAPHRGVTSTQSAPTASAAEAARGSVRPATVNDWQDGAAQSARSRKQMPKPVGGAVT